MLSGAFAPSATTFARTRDALRCSHLRLERRRDEQVDIERQHVLAGDLLRTAVVDEMPALLLEVTQRHEVESLRAVQTARAVGDRDDAHALTGEQLGAHATDLAESLDRDCRARRVHPRVAHREHGDHRQSATRDR